MDTQKAIDIIQKSEHIAIALPKEVDSDILSSTEVVLSLLEEAGKNVGFLEEPSRSSSIPPTFEHITRPNLLSKEFIISLDTLHSPLSEIRYERLENRIDIIIAPQKNGFSERAITYGQGKFICDALITIGIADIEETSAASRETGNFVSETSIINIDNSPRNTRYGEANIIVPGSISEGVYTLSAALSEKPLDAKKAQFLLAGIIDKTENFKSRETSAETLLVASELMRLGARREEAIKISRPSLPLPLLQLFSRSIVRSKIDSAVDMLWSYLTKEDFEKTHRTPDDAARVIEHLKREFPDQGRITLLWHGGNGSDEVSAAIASAPDHEIPNIREHGLDFGGSIILSETFPTFRDAELFIRSLIGERQYDTIEGHV